MWIMVGILGIRVVTGESAAISYRDCHQTTHPKIGTIIKQGTDLVDDTE